MQERDVERAIPTKQDHALSAREGGARRKDLHLIATGELLFKSIGKHFSVGSGAGDGDLIHGCTPFTSLPGTDSNVVRLVVRSRTAGGGCHARVRCDHPTTTGSQAERLACGDDGWKS